MSTASHELRTPLTSLGLMLHGASEELTGTQPDLPEARDQLRRALGQTERLGKLAEELLDLSRLDAGVELRAEPVELVELARSVLAEFEVGDSRAELAADGAGLGAGGSRARSRGSRASCSTTPTATAARTAASSCASTPAGPAIEVTRRAARASRPATRSGSSSASSAARRPARTAASASGSPSAASSRARWAAS